MTSLLIDELITTLTQGVNVKSTIKVASIKPEFYVHNMPSGTFNFAIWKNGDLYASEYFSSNDLRNSFGGSSNYFRVFFPFFFEKNLMLTKGYYEFKVTSLGYTFSTSSFLAICKDWQDYFGQQLPTSIEFTESPFSFRIIERKTREL